MARISYVDPATIDDPELAADLEHSRRYGTPRPETQAIRFHVPAVAKAFMRPWKTIFREGIVDHSLKELCRVFVSKTVECRYCGAQRSIRGAQEGLVEDDYGELLNFESSDRFDERQKAALLYTSMLVWNPEGVDDALWARLRGHFSEEQIVELGSFVCLTYGQQSVIRTWNVGHGELLADTTGGLAPARTEA
jgi:alkylhydroperoxidase family enzyme